MKKRGFRWLAVALMALAMVMVCVACKNDSTTDVESDEGSYAQTGAVETPTEAPTVPETEKQTDAPIETEEATTEEVTTLRELTWETYDPALDNSTVDPSATPVVRPTTWVATDGLDRVLPTHTQTGDVREEKILAMFYWTWHGDFADGQTAYNNQTNLDKLYAAGYTKADYWALSKAQLREMDIYVNNTSYHFWDEPVYGFYDGDDEWVIRKQAELLAAAGVDVVFFDNTNGSFTWLNTALKVMKVFSEARAQGVAAPCVSFVLPFGPTDGSRSQVISLFDNIYSRGLYQDVWFYLDGKPMLMGYESCLNAGDARQAEVRQFFSWRAHHGGYLDTEGGPNEWGWLSVYPQAYYHNTAGEIEQMTVGVAINHDYVNHVIAPMSGENVIGRTWTSRGIDTRENALFYGACFDQQWQNALSVDPKIVFVTGWNEWVAMRLPDWAGMYQNCYVDQFNAEFSRDCEPSNGIMRDYYYYQLVSNIRQFKGSEEIPQASQEKLIDVNGGYGQFADVGPVYTDYIGLPDRDCTGYRDPATGARLHYTNTSGRNDIYDCKVARDYQNLYFMVRTVEDMTPYTDEDWMHLYISVGETDQHWEHYEYVINKTTPEADKAYVERFTGNGYESTVVGQVAYKVTGNVMILCVPKTMLGIDEATLDFTIDFKWTDNTGVDFGGVGDKAGTKEPGEIMLWYTNGDVAPVGRFNYRYTTSAPEAYVPQEKTYGWSMMDFTSKEIRDDFDDLILSSVTNAKATVTDEGMVLTPEAANAKVILSYDAAPVGMTTDRYKYVLVTYKTSQVTQMKIGPAGGQLLKPSANRAISVSLEADGQEHTVLLDLSGARYWTAGYVRQIGFFFPSYTEGDSVTILSVRYFKDRPTEE